MKQIALKISSISMALLVLCSTVSFSVDQHFCGDFLVDSSWFGHAESCGMVMQQNETSATNCDLIKSNCCSDKTVLLKGQDDLNKPFSQFSFEQSNFNAIPQPLLLISFEILIENETPFKHYHPPLLVRNISVLHQTFLI